MASWHVLEGGEYGCLGCLAIIGIIVLFLVCAGLITGTIVIK